MENLILASTSPRRQEILRSLAVPYSIHAPDYDERPVPGLTGSEMAEYHAQKKVEAVIRDIGAKHPILGADTLIWHNDRIYGKPHDVRDAESMLRDFSGKTHSVITALCLYDSKNASYTLRTSISRVSFMELDQNTIERYLSCGEWQGVAGSYRIQGLAACLISHIEGSWSGIVGLPIHELYAILRERGYTCAL